MRPWRHEHAPRQGPLRLTDTEIAGIKRSALWVGSTVATALAADRSLAVLGLSHPVAVVSGFWRSGTTWLQEFIADSVGAKSVFEPLSPLDPRRRSMLGNSFATEDALQAFVPGPDQDEAFWRFFDAAAHGARGSRFTLSCRKNAWESFSSKIVVKDVRLHRNLRAVHDRLGVPVVHIRRHPCAVVASLRAANWHWSFDRVSLLDLPLPHADAGLLRDCDADGQSRLAAYWALHEREAASQIHDQPWAHEMTYEALVQAPHGQIGTACERLQLRIVARAASQRPSATIDPAAFAGVAARRPDFWTNILSRGEIRRIEQVASTIYPEWRTHWAA